MPNHCYNRVTFYSDDTTMILKLHKIWKSGLENDDIKENCKTVFGNFIPEPDWSPFRSGLRFKSTDVMDDRWYNWRVHNWGTKWDAYDLSVDECDLPHGFEVNFNTAWSPPEEVCNAIRDQFDDLSMSWFYDEPGCEIAGYL